MADQPATFRPVALKPIISRPNFGSICGLVLFFVRVGFSGQLQRGLSIRPDRVRGQRDICHHSRRRRVSTLVRSKDKSSEPRSM